jgi:tetratricopeptide (TPR) repeat protein
VVPGDTVGRYRVRELLGEGGMGVVFAAHDPRLGREVALKVIRADAGRSSYRQRVVREAQALARLSHPNVVPVFDTGVEPGVVWVAMQRVRGPTLAQWIAEHRPWSAILDAFVQAGRGLVAAHQAGLVHRDFKPGNAMFDADGRVVVLDFGLAWAPGPSTVHSGGAGRDDATDRVRGHSPASGRDPLGITITAAGSVVGTVPYMAPEQHEWREIDARSDQYAFCVSLYEALFGVRPFAGDVHAAAAAKRRGPPVPSTTALAEIPARLWRAIERGLQPDPDRRWPTLSALLTELVAIRRGRKRWPWAIAGAGAAASLAIAASSFADERRPCAATVALDSAWNDVRRDRLESAFATLGAAKDASWPRLRDRVDALATQWRAQADTACAAMGKAAPSSDELCLQRAAESLDEALTVLESPDPTRAARAVRLIEGLAERNDCARDAAIPSALSDEMRRRFERGRALMIAGALDEARDHATAMLADAQASGDTVAIAWALLLRGGAQLDGAGPRDAAKADLEDAMWTATSVGDDVAMTTASIKLAHWCALGYDAACAQPWLRSAEAGLGRLGDAGAAIERELDLARGDVALRNGARDEARAHYGRALAAVREDQGDHGLFETVVVEAIGIAHAQAGEHEDALRRFAEVDALQAKRLGRGDTARSSTLQLTAGSLYALGRYAEARSAQEQAIANLDAAFGEDHPHAIRARGNLVLLLVESGETEDALALAEEVVAQKRRAFGPTDVQVAIGLYNEGTVHTALGDHARAAQRYDESLALWEASQGESHVDLVHPLLGRANAAAETGDGARALATAQRALAICEKQREPVPPRLWFDLGRAHALVGDTATARAMIERAAEELPEQRRPGTISRADAVAWLAAHPA